MVCDTYNITDVSKKKKKGDETSKSCSEHGWRLLLIVYFFLVHVLVKLGGRSESRCRL